MHDFQPAGGAKSTLLHGYQVLTLALLKKKKSINALLPFLPN